MSAGELGEKATEVEKNLRKVMDRCTTWRAILLLDECDVFLEKRSESSLEKNRLVAVFLRMLEYYQGVLFLTTNRISAFDPTFESRIHLTIDYPKLDREARQRIWANFINAQSRSTISAWELRLLGQLELNGRQIKNMVKTAALLATAENVGLQFDHIMTVAKVKGLELHQRWEEKVDHGWWDPRISGPTIDLDSW
jgi:SpoVK/Ycf46/Vps4 family AAA+-type ATPase